MIPNITRGGNLPGVMAYLVSKGRAGEHVDAHLVAGSSAVLAWHGDDVLSSRAATAIGHELDRPRTATGVRVTQPLRQDGVKVGVKDAHVWHCSLALHPEENDLGDEAWAHISEAFVTRMGFVDEDRPPCRWVAVHHGRSRPKDGGVDEGEAPGSDHVHIVVGLVHEDGRKANVHHDRSRAQQVAGELEREFGLRLLESRQAGLGSRASTPAERGFCEERGETERERLARTVRACAAASADEAEFVRRVRGAGLRARPRYASGRDDVVAGYSVAATPAPGQRAGWYGGGRLARDLTLPRLRSAWPDTPGGAGAAVAEWRAARRNQPVVAAGRETRTPDPQLWSRYTQEVTALREQLRSVPVDDRAQWAHVAHETAGAFAAWSLQVEDEPGPLAATADVLARSAQLRARQARPRTAAMPSARGAAYVLASVAHGGSGTVAQTALLLQLANTAKALHDAHAAAGDVHTARRLEDVVRGQLISVVDRLPHAQGAGVDEQAVEALRTARQGLAAPREPGSPVPANVQAPAPRPTPPRTPDQDREIQR